MPSPLKVLASQQIQKRINQIEEEEINDYLATALQICLNGVLKFAEILEFPTSETVAIDDYGNKTLIIQLQINNAGSIESNKVEQDRQDNVIRSDRFRKDDVNALSSS